MEEKCEIIDIWDILSRRWSLLILKNINTKNVIRFNELKRNLKDISNTVLSDRLSELGREGLIAKNISAKYFKVEYRLTTKQKIWRQFCKVLVDGEKWELKIKV
jgi:DNA-binding HxlR family transcriptional regulator